MASILDYLDWRGDITFAERPFNEVDNLLLAELSYLDFGGIVTADFAAAVPLSDAVAAFTKRTPHADMGVLVPDKIPGLAQKMAASARFRDVLLSGYVCKLDEQTETQFAALCAALPDGTVYAAFRGTDDTIVGWKEDFNMGFLPIVPSQREAADYLRAVAAAFPSQKLRAGGHSKGGNLAVYAAGWCGESVQDQLLAVYNNDGPGFHTSLLDRPEHQRIANRIQTILPESSVVGMLLEHEESYQVVRSNQVGLMQHDGFSWQVLGTQFVHLSGLTEGGKIVDSAPHGLFHAQDRPQPRPRHAAGPVRHARAARALRREVRQPVAAHPAPEKLASRRLDFQKARPRRRNITPPATVDKSKIETPLRASAHTGVAIPWIF